MSEWTTRSTHQDLTTFSDDPEIRQRARRRLRRILIAVLVVVAVIALSARPTYRWVRNRLLDRSLENAKVAARVEDWATARNLARSVLLARSTDFEAFRIWFQALSHMSETRTYLVAASIFTDPRASRKDRLDALRVMAEQAPQAVAFSAYASMSNDLQQDPAALTAIAPLLTQRGETAYVEQVLRAAPAFATDPAMRLELLRALCSRPTAERTAEARALFVGLIDAQASEPALEALRLLGETPGGLAPGSPLPPLPEWVKLQPEATTLHHLLALHPSIEAAPNAADAVFESAIKRFLAVEPGVLGTWLIRHDKTALVAELLAEPAKTSPSAYIARLHALLREKNRAEIAAVLGAAPAACDAVELALAKVAAARLQRDSTAEAAAWTQALNSAAFDRSSNRFLEVGKSASLLKASKVIDDSWVAAVRSGWGQIPLYSDLTPVFGSLASQSRSEDMLAMYATLLRFEPQNPELLTNYYYLALLHGVVPPAAVVKGLEELTAANPQATDFLPALAMAYLMAKQPADALKLLPALNKSERVSPIARQALGGSALLLTGDTKAGTTLLKSLDWSAFMRCEAKAFRDLLNAPKFKNLPLPELQPLAPALDPDSVPAWRKAIERLEKDSKGDVLPALPAPRIPGSDRRAGNERESKGG